MFKQLSKEIICRLDDIDELKDICIKLYDSRQKLKRKKNDLVTQTSECKRELENNRNIINKLQIKIENLEVSTKSDEYNTIPGFPAKQDNNNDINEVKNDIILLDMHNDDNDLLFNMNHNDTDAMSESIDKRNHSDETDDLLMFDCEDIKGKKVYEPEPNKNYVLIDENEGSQEELKENILEQINNEITQIKIEYDDDSLERVVLNEINNIINDIKQSIDINHKIDSLTSARKVLEEMKSREIKEIRDKISEKSNKFNKLNLIYQQEEQEYVKKIQKYKEHDSEVEQKYIKLQNELIHTREENREYIIDYIFKTYKNYAKISLTHEELERARNQFNQFLKLQKLIEDQKEQINQLNVQITSNQTDFSMILQNSRNRISQLEDEVEQYRSQQLYSSQQQQIIYALQAEKDDLLHNLNDIKYYSNDLSNQMKALSEQNAQYSQRISELEAYNHKQNNSEPIISNSSKILELQNENDELKEQMKIKMQDLNDTRIILQNRIIYLQVLEAEKEKLEIQSINNSTKINQLESKNQELLSYINHLRASENINQAQYNHEQEQNIITQRENEIIHNREQISSLTNSLNQQHQEFQEILSQMKTKIMSLNRENSELKNNNNLIIIENSKIRSDFATLSQQNKYLIDKCAILQEQLNKSQNLIDNSYKEDLLAAKQEEIKLLNHKLNQSLETLNQLNAQMDQLNNENSQLKSIQVTSIHENIIENTNDQDVLNQKQKEIHNLNQQLKCSQEALTQMNSKMVLIDKANNKLKTQLSLVEAENNQLRSDISQINQQNQSILEKYTELQGQLRMSPNSKEDINIENVNTQIKNTIHLLNDQLKDSQNTIILLNQENNELKDEFNIIQEKYDKIDQQNKSLVFKYEQLNQKQTKDKDTKYGESNSQNEMLLLRDQLNNMQTAMKKMSEENMNLIEEISRYKSDLDETNQKNQSLMTKITQLQEKINENSKLEGLLFEKQNEIQSLNNQLNEHQETNKQRENILNQKLLTKEKEIEKFKIKTLSNKSQQTEEEVINITSNVQNDQKSLIESYQQQIMNLESKISNFEKEIDEYKAKNMELGIKIKELNDIIDKRDKLMSELQNESKQSNLIELKNDDEIEEINLMIKSQNKESETELKSILEEKNNQINELQLDLNLVNSKINEYNKELDFNKEQNTKHQSIIEEKENQINELTQAFESKLTEANEQVRSLKEQIALKEEKSTQINQVPRDQEQISSENEYKSMIEEKEIQLNIVKQTLIELNEENSLLKENLNAESQINQLNEQKISDLQNIINKLTDESRQTKLDNQNELKNRDKEILEINTLVSEQNIEIKTLNEEGTEFKSIIEEKQNQISELTLKFNIQLKELRDEKDQIISDLQSKLNKLLGENDQIKQDIQNDINILASQQFKSREKEFNLVIEEKDSKLNELTQTLNQQDKIILDLQNKSKRLSEEITHTKIDNQNEINKLISHISQQDDQINFRESEFKLITTEKESKLNELMQILDQRNLELNDYKNNSEEIIIKMKQKMKEVEELNQSVKNLELLLSEKEIELKSQEDMMINREELISSMTTRINEQFEDLKTQIRCLEQENQLLRKQKNDQEIIFDEKIKEITHFEQELASMRDEIESKQHEIDETTDIIILKEEIIRELQNKLDEKETQNTNLELEINNYEKLNLELNTKMNEFDDLMRNENLEIENLRNQNRILQDEKIMILNRNEGNTKELAEYNLLKKQYEEQINQKESEISRLNTELDSLNANLNDRKCENNVLIAENNRLMKMMTNNAELVEEPNNELISENVKDNIKEVGSQCDEQISLIEDLRNQNHKINNELSNKIKDLINVNAKFQSISTELESTKAKNSVLQQEIENKNNLIAEIKDKEYQLSQISSKNVELKQENMLKEKEIYQLAEKVEILENDKKNLTLTMENLNSKIKIINDQLETEIHKSNGFIQMTEKLFIDIAQIKKYHESEINKLLDINIELEAKYKDGMKEIEDLKNILSNETKSCLNKDSQIDVLNRQIEEVQKELTDMIGSHEILEEQLKTEIDYNKSLHRKQIGYEKQYAKIQQELEEKTQIIQSINKKLFENYDTLSIQQNETINIKSESDYNKDQYLSDIKNINIEHNKRISNLTDKIVELTNEIEENKENYINLTKDNQKLISECKRQSIEINNMKKEHKLELNKLETQNQEIKDKVKTLEDNITQIEIDKVNLLEELSKLRQREAEFGAYSNNNEIESNDQYEDMNGKNLEQQLIEFKNSCIELENERLQNISYKKRIEELEKENFTLNDDLALLMNTYDEWNSQADYYIEVVTNRKEAKIAERDSQINDLREECKILKLEKLMSCYKK